MDQDKPEVVIIADPLIATTPATGSKGAIEEERLMEIVETETEKQPKKEKYGKAAIELAKQLENVNPEEEETSEEPFVEIVLEIRSEEDENPQANVLSTPPVYAKAGGQNVKNITNPEKFARVMQIKKQMKEKRIAQDKNKGELEKVKTRNFQQLAGYWNDRIKYRRGLGKHGQVLNKALKEGKYIVNYQVPTLDEEVALMVTELINQIYDEAGLEIQTIRYYELQFHVLQANLPEKLWHIFEGELAEWMTTRPPWKAYEAGKLTMPQFGPAPACS
uniref:Uncharacterized protein n=1 Tax=Romanomermis culicivorax TaxID=13658 RepID=A0A915IAK0_ROMCU